MIYDNLKAQDDEYLLHAYGRAPVAIKSGKGAIAEDYDGKKYIDFTAGIVLMFSATALITGFRLLQTSFPRFSMSATIT